MPPTATIRELRGSFPKVKQLVETEGAVVVSDRGQPKYILSLYTPPASAKSAPAKDYMSRLARYQPDPMSEAEASALHDENRGDR
jgi:hypothetical protein